jgi:hypothetical protein
MIGSPAVRRAATAAARRFAASCLGTRSENMGLQNIAISRPLWRRSLEPLSNVLRPIRYAEPPRRYMELKNR